MQAGMLSIHCGILVQRKSMIFFTLVLVIFLIKTSSGWYVPSPTHVTWNYQLSDNGSATYIPNVDLYVIDIDTARDFIPYLRTKKSSKAKVICYFSAGTFETYRVDNDEDRGRHSFTKAYWGSSIGRPMDGWPGEYWVDVRSKRVRNIAKKRMKFARDIGCAGVDPDNVDGYTFTKKQTGFTLTKKDQISFNRYLAKTAHSLGLGIGLKNAIELVDRIGSSFDWFINESCFTFDECIKYNASRKAVFMIEYCDAQEELGEPTQDPGCYCPESLQQGWNTLLKKADLSAPRVSCDEFCQEHPSLCSPSHACQNIQQSCPSPCDAAGTTNVCSYLHTNEQ